MRLSEGLEDETVLEIKVLWNTSQEGVVLSVDFPGPNYKVQVCASLELFVFPSLLTLDIVSKMHRHHQRYSRVTTHI